ncbi:unnamed protein product [Camellia sinensis]
MSWSRWVFVHFAATTTEEREREREREMLEAKSLRKAMVPCSLLEHPSPGSVQSTRLMPTILRAGSTSLLVAAFTNFRISMQDSLVNQGKESLLIPEQTQVMSSSIVNRCPHRSEIQSIALAETESSGYLILGSVDSYGHLIVSKLDTSGKGMLIGLHFQYHLEIVVLERVVGQGFASVQINGPWLQLLHTASAEALMYMTKIFTSRLYVRLWYPSSLSFMQSLCSGNDSSILAVTEGCQLSIWDLRMKENGGCVHRIYGSVGDIFYAVCSSSTSIAVGGADRTVTVYDPRSGGQHYRDGCTAQNMRITGLAFASIDSDYIYIQGVDYEVLCGQWKESKKVFSFRGDSNWLGFSKCANKDVLGGWCDSGSIFVADIAKENKLQTADDFCNEVIC